MLLAARESRLKAVGRVTTSITSEVGAEIFGVTTSQSESLAVLYLTGELDLYSAAVLADALDAVLDREQHVVVLDLADLDFMDTTGLQVIATAATRLEHTNGQLTLRHPSPTVRRILTITRLDELVRLEPRQEVADMDPG